MSSDKKLTPAEAFARLKEVFPDLWAIQPMDRYKRTLVAHLADATEENHGVIFETLCPTNIEWGDLSEWPVNTEDDNVQMPE